MAIPQRVHPDGIGGDGLRLAGALLAAAGAAGSAVFQNGLLGLSQYTNAELLAAMQASDTIMGYATAAIVLQAIGTCALPVFAMLLCVGFSHTAELKKYALRLALLALACELPYNLAVSGTWWAPASRNPVWGLLLALGVLYLCRHFSAPGARGWLVCAAVLASGLFWAYVLRIDSGMVLVLLTAVLWLLRGNPLWQVLGGCAAASPAFPAPAGMLIVHFYNGSEGRAPRWLRYAWYPVMLACMGGIGALLR